MLIHYRLSANIYIYIYIGKDWAYMTIPLSEKVKKKMKRRADRNEEFTRRTKLPADSQRLSEEEVKFVNKSCASHTFPRSYGSSLRGFLDYENVGFLKV